HFYNISLSFIDGSGSTYTNVHGCNIVKFGCIPGGILQKLRHSIQNKDWKSAVGTAQQLQPLINQHFTSGNQPTFEQLQDVLFCVCWFMDSAQYSYNTRDVNHMSSKTKKNQPIEQSKGDGLEVNDNSDHLMLTQENSPEVITYMKLLQLFVQLLECVGDHQRFKPSVPSTNKPKDNAIDNNASQTNGNSDEYRRDWTVHVVPRLVQLKCKEQLNKTILKNNKE
ncbi:hypothetical protein RFI_13938, partial [Reticulomyxa filosa]